MKPGNAGPPIFAQGVHIPGEEKGSFQAARQALFIKCCKSMREDAPGIPRDLHGRVKAPLGSRRTSTRTWNGPGNPATVSPGRESVAGKQDRLHGQERISGIGRKESGRPVCRARKAVGQDRIVLTTNSFSIMVVC